MANSSSLSIIFTLLLPLFVIGKYATGCYTSIFSIGDSLSDNGNLLALLAPKIIHQGRPPNGNTYFHHPTGRCCDGRLIVDFIAQSFGLPIPPPYLGMKKDSTGDAYTGVNFAVAGARALDCSFYENKGIAEPITNVTLRTQLDWFRELLPSLCGTKASCKKYLRSSLLLMGEIGGNDYNHALLQGRSIEEVKSFVPMVIEAISSAIDEMIELGALNFIVPGDLPFGCSAAYLTYFQPSTEVNSYDKSTGCIEWLNDLSKQHNRLLQIELDRLRDRYPQAIIVYADYYNSAMRLYRSPGEFGFAKDLSACCGAGGPYNFNPSVGCGDPASSGCDDPSVHVCWDGLHMTEAANRWVVQGLFEGPFSFPHLKVICPSVSTGLALSNVF